jgi:hypothetical protein
LKNRRILIESVLVCLVLLGLAACTPTPPENIYWEPDGSGFIRFRTDDPANADKSFLTLYFTSGVIGGGVPPAFHDLRSPRFRNCTVCHLKVHGSQVNRALLR